MSRAENLAAIVEGLSLLKTIPHARHPEVVPNGKIDPPGNEVNVVVYGEFADTAALAAWKAHPTCQELIARVRPLREMRLSADYEVPG